MWSRRHSGSRSLPSNSNRQHRLSGTSDMSRVQDRFQAVPVGTLALVCVNVAVHGLVFVTSFNAGLISISAYQVIYQREYYRVVTAAFTHGGVLHILMNMMSLLQLGSLLEKSFGTLIFVMLSIWSVLLCGFIYVLSGWATSVLLSAQGQLHTSAVGYSGVLFSYALISSYHTSAPTQSVFGLFNVPSKIYPWILLGIMQVILPNISLLGHLSGIIVGLFTVYGPLELFLMPSKGASYIAMLVWTAVAAVLHIVGCPASVTSLSCCNSGLRYITSIWSWLYSHSWRENYDEVSGSAEGDMRPMVTAGVRPIGLPANILRPGNGYERVSMSDVPETQENSRGKKNTTIDVDNGPTIDL